MDLDMDSGTELPALQKKARAGSGRSDVEEDEHQWDNIPPPRSTDQRLASHCPWGNEVMVIGKPLSESSSSGGRSKGSHAEESSCATGSIDQSLEGATGESACAGKNDSLYSAASDLTQVMTLASPNQSQPIMLGARPKFSCSVDSCHSDFRSPPREQATEPYRTCAGRMKLHREDWTYYAQQDEVRPGDLHLEWPENMRTVGPRRIPAGYEGTFRPEHSKPHAPTFHGRLLRRKHGLKVPKSWGNAGERPSIRRTMEEGVIALENDKDWVAHIWSATKTLRKAILIPSWPLARYYPLAWLWPLHMSIPAPLGQQQPDLHERLVYSSIYGIPLIAPAEAQGIRTEHRRDRARMAAAHGGRRVGYVSNNQADDCSHRDEVHNRWRKGETHFECHHEECFVMTTTSMYFTSEEEYVAHWNSFHAAISLWFICPANGCPYVAAGEPDALDWYLDHVAQQHVTSDEGGRLERDGAETAEGTIRWGLNYQYRWPGFWK